MSGPTLVITQLRLRPGVTPDAYERWAAAHAGVPRAQPSIADWRLVRADQVFGAPAGARPPFDFLEVVELRDTTQFQRDVATPAMQQLQRDVAERAELTPVLTHRVA